MKPRVLILRAAGINRDGDAARAVVMAGGQPDLVHIGRIVDGSVSLFDYAMVIVPGGFSYGDVLGSGRATALIMKSKLAPIFDKIFTNLDKFVLVYVMVARY